MTLLSICIPVFGLVYGQQETVIDTVRQMLRNERADFEILIGDFSEGSELLSQFAKDQADTRLTVITPGPEIKDPALPLQKSVCWSWMIPHTIGKWITLISEADYADPDICAVIEATLKRVPQTDALSWGRATYVWPEARVGRETAKIGTGSSLNLPQQKDMMQKLFYWADATDRPACHSGVWHGAVRRELMERIREAFSDVYFEQADPEIDNLCKTVLIAQRMAYWERPMSVQGVSPMAEKTSPAGKGDRLEGFPFSPEIGLTAGISVTIEMFKRRYGIELDRWEDGFIKACTHDCETATTGEQFHARKAVYAKAITEWRGKRALSGFKPEFKRNPKLPRFQGLKGQHFYFDMDMDHTQSAAEFYTLIDAMLFPVHLLDAKLA